ncbi:OLC1v1037857C1 [Oldenlandia corymbosa var. corymbosa]|uniref:Growth-regulating factor n=1 Tax=Oldenlandia corymbosa var. corymbosa TaxID=529605 RepID=A0AAV1CZW8_OLDCO|nr:OLC1v1037857C1 [Oldenlandia corymbosa var. corymbosa]
MSTATASRNSSTSGRFPFTASQWQELEHQALIFKYMVSGMPVPPDLLYTVRRSLDSSISSKLILHQPQLGWNCFQMGFGRKIDPEPGRCRRTDGKKWRCSKEAYPDSKYCERHMHRGRNRSRKPVELITTPTPFSTSLSTNNTSSSSSSTPNLNPPTAIPLSSMCSKPTNNNNSAFSPSSPTSHHSFSCLTSLAHSEPPHHHTSYSTSSGAHYNHPNFLFTHSSSSSQENATTNFLLGSREPYSHGGGSKGYSYGQGGKEEVDHEHAFFSEPSGTIRNLSGSSTDESSWQLSPLTMGSSHMGHMKQERCYSGGHCPNNYLQLQSLNDKRQQLYPMGTYDDKNHELGLMLDRDDQPKKVMHHFFD